MAKISVVIPVYGVEKYIDQLLDSVRKQTLHDIEVIFVDDGSPDNCPAILDRFVSEDNRYHVIHQKNAGVSTARNNGLAQATGEYIYLADSDDWLEENALEVLWNEATRTSADVVYGDYYCVKGDNRYRYTIFDAPFYTESKDTIKILQCAVNLNGRHVQIKSEEFDKINAFGGAPWRLLIKRSLIVDNDLRFDPYVKGLADDILFTLHLYEHVRSVAYIQEPIYNFRVMELSYTKGYKANLLEVYSRIFEKMELFLQEYKKDRVHWDYYYLRIYLYMHEALHRYFKNKNNPKTEKERFAEFKSVLNTEPYKTAIKKVPISVFGNNKEKLQIFMLRYGMHSIYWNLKSKNR